MDKLLASLLTVLAALLFSVGYIYLNSYYNEIGISLLEVSYSIQDVIVHSVVVFYRLFLELWDFRILAVLMTLTFFGVSYWVSPNKDAWRCVKCQDLKQFSVLFFVVVVALSIGWALSFSRKLGIENAQMDMENAKPLWVSGGGIPQAVLSPLENESAELVFLSASDRFIFAAIKYSDGADRWVIRFDRDKIGSFRVFWGE